MGLESKSQPKERKQNVHLELQTESLANNFLPQADPGTLDASRLYSG
jgi:hypothetical protein